MGTGNKFRQDGLRQRWTDTGLLSAWRVTDAMYMSGQLVNLVMEKGTLDNWTGEEWTAAAKLCASIH